MTRLAKFALIIALSATPAFAKKAPVAPTVPAAECTKVETILTKLNKDRLIADLTGDELAKFNAGYEQATKQKAPSADRVLVYEVKDHDVVVVDVVFGFTKGCGVGAAGIAPKDFDKWRKGSLGEEL